MTQQASEQGEDFYARALQTNERGNNRSRAHNRPERHGWSFQRPGGLVPDPACSLSGADHRGQVSLCRYVDHTGMFHHQLFCEGHRGAKWEPMTAEEWRAWITRRRRRTSDEPAASQPQPRRR